MVNRKIKIFLAENVPSLNKGEMTILGGMLESFKVLGEVQVTMISDVPQTDIPRCEPEVTIIDISRYLPLTKEVYKNSQIIKQVIKLIDSIPILSQHIWFLLLFKIFGNGVLRIMKAPLWRTIVEADAIVQGHAGTFSLGGGLGTPIYLYPVFIPWFAKRLRKPVMFYGGSISLRKQQGFPVKFLLHSALRNMDVITLREEISYRKLKDSGYAGSNAMVIADPAFLLPPSGAERVREVMRAEGIDKASGPLIGFTLTQAMASQAYPSLGSKESYQKHTAELARVIDSIVDKINAKVIFLPHCIGLSSDQDDRIISAQVREQCKNKANIKVITNEYNAGEMKGLIGECDVFIGERLHSVINGLTMYVPSIIIASSLDSRLGIIKMAGQEKAIFNVEDYHEKAFFTGIMEVWEKREAIRRELKSQVPVIQERARQNGIMLRELLEKTRKKYKN